MCKFHESTCNGFGDIWWTDNPIYFSSIDIMCMEHIVFDRDMIVSSTEIEDIIVDLACNKSSGLDGLTSEHMKFANSKLPVLLSILMSAVLIHGHVPRSAIRSVLVPIIKNKNKRITDKDNYRPICLSNVFTKVIERCYFVVCKAGC